MDNKSKLVRVTVDFPMYEHIDLKVTCAKKGSSIRQFILDAVKKSLNEVNGGNEQTEKRV